MANFEIDQLVKALNDIIDVTHENVDAVVTKFRCRPQHPDWYPGTPTKHEDDMGWYICPINPDEWDVGDFDMLIEPDGNVEHC